MAWAKGQTGNPLGLLRDKPYRDALRMEIAAGGTNSKLLRAIAKRHLALAAEGKMDAINALADRLDGKPAQESTVTVDDKRDAPDWRKVELVAFVNDAIARGARTAAPDGRGGEPDKVH